MIKQQFNKIINLESGLLKIDEVRGGKPFSTEVYWSYSEGENGAANKAIRDSQ